MSMKSGQRGFTLIETLITIAIFTIMAVSVYRAMIVVVNLYSAVRVRVAATTVANQDLELIRNLSYDKVGLVDGIPSGLVASSSQVVWDNMTFTITRIIRNIDDPFDGTLGGTPNDLAPADYKLVNLSVSCAACPVPSTFDFTGRIAPKNLETSSSNGALFVQVINANGQPVIGVSVNVTNTRLNPAINITDVTDTTGFLKLVDVPPATQSYHIVVTKSGYSTDQSYATSSVNPNPVKPDATIALQQVTQLAFAIDNASQLNAESVTDTCTSVPNVNFSLTSSKLIGTTPDIPKFNQSYMTDTSGTKVISNLEWDNYSLVFTNAGYDIAGTIPLLPLVVNPGANINFKMVMRTKVSNGVLVTVKDGASGLPLSGASVTLSRTGYSTTLITGRGFLSQTDWSGGSGQTLFTDAIRYADDDGNIDAANPAGEVKLKQVAPPLYASSGFLTSSIFDTGSASNFYNLTWNPGSQPPDAGSNSLKFQLATATTSSPSSWQFLGPDGSTATYYTIVNGNVNATHNGDRYFRYRAYFGTASTTFTPRLSDVALTFASACVSPGQVFFNALPNDLYTLAVSLNGYQAYSAPLTTDVSWQEVVVPLVP